MSGRLVALLEEGVATGVFPCAAAVVRHEGRVVFEGGAGGASAATVFDLASLTKVLATTAVFLSLWAEDRLAPETPVARLLPGARVRETGATVGDLLAHRAGLPAFRPFFADALARWPQLLDTDCPPVPRLAARRAVVDGLLATAPESPRGERAVYSDVGFAMLGELLAAADGAPLDALYGARVAGPLGLAARFRRLSAGATGVDAIPATGATRPRPPAPGQEGQWPPTATRPDRRGEVDDDNAWVMDGVAGHAGLFGTARDVATFGQAVLDDLAGAGRLAPAARWATALARDAGTPGSTRALGFDTRQPGDPAAGSSAGTRLGMEAPGAVGHTGFTGTSLWIDRARRLVVSLCTNRTGGPRGRAATGITAFRPCFHDAVVASLPGER